jgi:hypothetical protein
MQFEVTKVHEIIAAEQANPADQGYAPASDLHVVRLYKKA